MVDVNKNSNFLPALASLQENGSQFFSKVFDKYPNSFSCKEGCSKCCYVDLSVFEIEAANIVSWFFLLPISRQNELKNIWRQQELELGENANQEPNYACAFLVNEKCSVYEARPLICRTQGAPLFFQEVNKVDICPLNFQDEELPLKEDWLSVDRINMLLGLVQNQYAKEAGKKLETRVPLKDLQNFLKQ